MIDHADDAARSFGRRERMILELVRPSFVRVVEEADATRERYRVLGVTRREVEVLALVREGLTNGEIASKLFIAPTTVRSHLENAFAKLGAHTRTEAVAHLARLHPHRYTAKCTPTRDDVEPEPIQLRL